MIWRAPVRFAACPTQPYKCGQYVKIKVKKSLRAGCLGRFLSKNPSARADWTYFYVKIPPRGLIGQIFKQKSLRAG